MDSIPGLAAVLRRAHDPQMTGALPHTENSTESGAGNDGTGNDGTGNKGAGNNSAGNGRVSHLGGMDLGRCHLHQAGLVPMYRIAPGSPEPAAEATAAAQVILTVGDRLRRLTGAYGEWHDFDPAAYFDLTPPQTACLVQLSERVSSVHLVFFTDLLLPSFREAALYWETCFLPHYRRMQRELLHHQYAPALEGVGQSPDPEQPLPPGHHTHASELFFDEIQPALITRWLRLLNVANHTRRLLSDEPAFWALNAANDERLRRRWAWRMRPAPGVAAALLPTLTDIPTLTLAIDFPLPTARQSGRLRRLRRGRAHLGRRSRPPRPLS